MKSSLLVFTAIGLITFEASAGTRTRRQALQQTADITVSTTEVLEQFGNTPSYPTTNVGLLKSEIESCGITYNGTSCLDTTFENFGNAGVRDVDTGDKSGYVFFSRFKMKKDKRILLMAVIANKSDCVVSKRDPKKCEIDLSTRKNLALPAFRTGNIWAITPGREKPETYIADFLKCTETEEECKLRPLLAYDPIKDSAEETAINDLEGIRTRFANDYRRFFQATQIASKIRTRSVLDKAVRAIEQRSEIITKSGNAIYRAAFFNLIQTNFSKFPELVASVAREIADVAPARSQEQLEAVIIAISNGDTSTANMEILVSGFNNTRISSAVRKEAIKTYAQLASSTAEKNKILQLLSSSEQVLRSGAYSALDNMQLSEENIPAINKLLSNKAENIRGNGLKALSRVSGAKGMERMALVIKDKSVDVALSAAGYLKETLRALDSISEVEFIYLLENTTIAAVTNNSRDRRVLETSLIPAREDLLAFAFTKTSGTQQSTLVALKNSATNHFISIRVEAIRFINQLTIPDATITLIGLMSDTNVDVTTEVMKALNTKLLTDTHLDLLFKTSISPNVSIRRNAVSLIGKVSSKRALQALLRKVQENIDSSSWMVRGDIAQILGAIYDTSATTALITLMSDVKKEVRQQASSQLMKADRLYDDTQIKALKALLESSYSDVPSRVITILGQVNTLEMTQIIVSYLGSSNLDLRNSAENSLKLKVLNESELALLEVTLKNANPEVRVVAVRLLSKSALPLAKEMLTSQLSIEADELVRIEIQTAIDPII